MGPNCSVNDGDSCVSNHDCTHNACKIKVHVNGAVGFVHMSGNELQRSLSLDGLVHCESVDDDTGVVDNWPLTFAESDDMVHAEQRASDVIEMGAMTTGAHAVQRASGDVIEALTTVAHAEQRVSSDMMEDLVEPAHAEQRMFGSDRYEVRSSVFDTDDPGHAEQRGGSY